VAEGDLVIVLEAMKMENALKAHKAGIVALNVEPGEVVNSGDPLAKIEDSGGDSADPREEPDA
jgi:acetyl-CoA/propionyl-CoA carboxylase, biotin carboxylase, biotin carboxyl carrier protein